MTPWNTRVWGALQRPAMPPKLEFYRFVGSPHGQKTQVKGHCRKPQYAIATVEAHCGVRNERLLEFGAIAGSCKGRSYS